MSCPSVSPDGRTVLCNPDNLTDLDIREERFAYYSAEDILWKFIEAGDVGETDYREDFAYWDWEYGSKILLLRLPGGKGEFFRLDIPRKEDRIFYFPKVCWSPDAAEVFIPSFPGPDLFVTVKNYSVRPVPPGLEGEAYVLPAGWSENGKEFFFIKGGYRGGENIQALCRFDLENNHTKVLFTAHEGEFCTFCASKRLVYTQEWNKSREAYTFFVTDLKTGGRVPVGDTTVPFNLFMSSGDRFRGASGGGFLFAVDNGAGRPYDLKLFVPQNGSVRTLATASYLEPLCLSPDEKWALYYCGKRQPCYRADERMGLRSVNLETGETRVIAKDDANFWEEIAWAEGPTVIFVKGNKEIWAGAVDGSRSWRLYPEKTQ
jgi:hypothetical protein